MNVKIKIIPTEEGLYQALKTCKDKGQCLVVAILHLSE